MRQCLPIILDTGDKIAGISGFSLSTLWPWRKCSDDYTPDEIRTQLLKLTQNGIDDRSLQALHNDIQIPLYLESQHQQVGREQPSLIEPKLKPNRYLVNLVEKVLWPGRELQPQETLFDVFEDVHQRLLILGDPGSGKTTELLSLAKRLCQQAKEETLAPVPVILQLSSWNGQSITDWAIKQINRPYESHLPEDLLRKGVAHGDFLLLLDGLDELGTLQDDCIQTINEFIEHNAARRLVVCCRQENYESSPLQLKHLNGAVHIEPLQDQQIRNYFQQLNLLEQWNDVKRNPVLLKLARKPLFLHILALTTEQKTPIRNQTELFDAYIEKKFNDIEKQLEQSRKKFTSRKQTRHYLIWLAQQLKRTHKTEFYVENLQPSWLLPNEPRLFYLHKVAVCLASLPFTLILSNIFLDLTFGLTVPIEDSIGTGPSSRLVWAVSLIWAILIGFSSKEIEPVERLTFAPNSLSGIFAWSILGLVGGLLTEFFFKPVGTFLESPLLIGLILASGLGLLAGAWIGLSGSLSSELLPEKNKRIPNEAIWRSLQNTYKVSAWTGCLLGGLGGICMGIFSGLYFGSLL